MMSEFINNSQLLFVGGQEPDASIIQLKLANGSTWYRGSTGWARDAWCGRFPDNTVRAPWLDEQFCSLWETEGPEAARDKSRYDLSYLNLQVDDIDGTPVDIVVDCSMHHMAKAQVQ